MIDIIPRRLAKNCCWLRANHKIHGAARIGFTLIELVLVLMILAILAGAAISMVDVQVDQTRFESTQQTLQAIERAVLGPDHARATDGSRSVSGFVADCGRLPRTLEELYIRPANVPVFSIQPPVGDPAPVGDPDAETHADDEVRVAGGWNGPYLRLPIGSTSLPDGWAAGFLTYQSDGVSSDATKPLAIILSLGRDERPDGSGYDADLSLVFNSTTPTVPVDTGLGPVAVPVLVQNRWQKTVSVAVNYNDSSTEPDPVNGEMIVVRVYGPHADPDTGNVTLRTIQQKEITDYKTSSTPPAPFPVTVTFSDLAIGPRIIRAYQLDSASVPEEEDELSSDSDLKAVSVPTRLVVSRETSSINLILKDD